MDISKVLEQLRRELENLDAAIVSLERLQQRGLRRGRPPKSRTEAGQPKPMPRPAEGGQTRRGGASE
jgi:hypothetical protein